MEAVVELLSQVPHFCLPFLIQRTLKYKKYKNGKIIPGREKIGVYSILLFRSSFRRINIQMFFLCVLSKQSKIMTMPFYYYYPAEIYYNEAGYFLFTSEHIYMVE